MHGDDLARMAIALPWCWNRNPLAQPLMRARHVEISDAVLLEHGFQVPFTEDDYVIQGLASYASEKALACWIHDGRLRL